MEPGRDNNPEQDQLAADLREAFGYGGESFEFGGHTSRRSPGGSSGQFGAFTPADGLGVGARLGDFEILDELGHGGMGVVYRARQVSLARDVALKVLPTFGRRGRAAVQRFRTEAQAAARLHHTNIVPIYAQGEDGGRYYYAMELVDGGSLHLAIRSRSRLLSPSNPKLNAGTPGPRSLRSGADDRTVVLSDRPDLDERAAPAEAWATGESDDARLLRRTRDDYRHLARMISEVADGLQHAHQCGVIHRDIKPQNLLVGADNRLHITDFGLARLADAPGMTITGEVMGTPAYLSPEQVRADQQAIDQRTDVYSLGVTLYELLTLRRPFQGETREQIISGICHVQPRAPQRIDPQIPRDMQTICLKAMEKEPVRRYQSAGAMAEDLRRFADGRPILSRPVGPIVRAGKWARRHKAATTAIVTGAVTMMLGAGLTASVVSARHQQAEDLILKTYERLVYLDYRGTDSVRNNLDEAERLGGDPVTIGLLRGLADLFDRDETGRQRAIDQLHEVLARDPDNPEAVYLLACAYDRNYQQPKADELIAQADALNSTSAAAWFFRGLALHYDRTDEAIRSYETACRLRLGDGEIFLQATLQLARAHNQRMYTTRTIEEDFAGAVSALEQLIDFGVYKAHPYHLLAVAHLLAAEILKGSQGTRDESGVEQHYELSLAVASEGQKVDPEDPRPILTEAQCLESMGEFEAAIAARTRAIAVAGSDHHHFCESHHYRWRLYYWMGMYDESLADIEVHTGCPQTTPIYYEHLYPALLYAESGEMERAVEEVLAVTTENPRSAIDVICTATWLNLLGEPEEAARHLAIHATDVDYSIGIEPFQSPEWIRGLYDLVQGKTTVAELLELAEASDQPWRLRGEAEFHAAARKLAAGERREAFEGFTRAYRSFDSQERYTFHARIFCVKMSQDSAWPSWIPVEGLDSSGPDGIQP